MNRLIVVLIFLGLIWQGCQLPDSTESDSWQFSSPPPDCNILMISLDTLRQDRLGVYGNPLGISPVLDRFTSNAIVFSDNISQAPSTVTSHRSIFTSTYLSKAPSRDPKPRETLAGFLGQHGWITAAFVDGGLMHHRYGNAAGFQLYDDSGGGFRQIIPKAIDWITQQEHPFFLFLHSYDIHCPYYPPEPYREMFSSGLEPSFELEGKCGRSYFNQLNLDHDGFRIIADHYDGGVRYTDSMLNRLFLFLLREGLLDRTIIIVLSDHGESLGERDYIGHRRLYDVQIKVPLLIRVPGNSGVIYSAPVENIDVMPSLMEMFNFPISENLAGIPFDLRITTPKEKIKRTRISENHTWSGRAVRNGGPWKLIVRENAGEDELYDLDEDPEEVRNRLREEADMADSLRRDCMARLGEDEKGIRRKIKTAIIRNKLRVLGENTKKSPRDPVEDQLKTLGYID